MRILVVYGNDELIRRTKAIFDRYACGYTKDIFVTDFSKFKHYELIFSLHAKIIFPKDVVEATRCVNIHPGYLPYNRGMFPHVWSIINGLPAGATIHEMDKGIDTGPILARKGVEVLESDTSESLYKRVLEAEINLLNETIDDIVHKRLVPFRSLEPSNYNSLEDYYKLCKLDPAQSGTLYQFYNKFRALSHGEFKNMDLEGVNFKLQIL